MAGLRFQAAPFQYNTRVALALLPALLFLVSLGGKTAFGLLVVGAMVTYILDALQLKEASLMSAVGTLFSTNIAIMIAGDVFDDDRPVVFSLFIMIMSMLTLFLSTVWATLQFRWIQVQHPAVVLALERLLIGSLSPSTAMTYAWLCVASFGSTRGPFYLMAILCGLYWMFGRPIRSSFFAQTPGRAPKVDLSTLVLDRGEGFVNFLVTALVPGCLYLTSHMKQLDTWVHVWSVLMLFSAPVVFACVMTRGVWWLARDSTSDSPLRRLMLYPALLVLVAAFEGRVVFRSFASYIKIPAPWSYVHVSLVMYFAAFIIAAHFEGLMARSVSANLGGLALVLAFGAGAMAAGFPTHIIPAPIACAVGLALYYDSGLFRDYLIFALGAVVSIAYFITQNFVFLDIALNGIPLRIFCYIIIAFIAVAVMLPGLVAARAPKLVTGLTAIAATALLAVLEETMYLGDGTVPLGEMYPAYLVVVTSAAVFLLADALLKSQRVPRWAAWILQCTAGAKLAVFLINEDPVVVPVLLMLLAASPPLLLYAAPPVQTLGNRPFPTGYRMPVSVATMHVVTVVLAVANARFFLFDLVMALGSPHPKEGVLLGALVLTVAVGCAPLLTRFFPNAQTGRRLMALTVSFGILLVLLCPPLPIRGGARCPRLPMGLCPRLWDERHVPNHEADDPLVYGDRTREHFPLWLLIAAVMTGLFTATAPMHAVGKEAMVGAGGIDLDQDPSRRPATAPLLMGLTSPAGVTGIVASALLGAYFALEFFSGRASLQAAVAATSVLTGLALVMVRAIDPASVTGPTVKRHGGNGAAMHSPLLFPTLVGLAVTMFAAFALTYLVPLPELPRSVMMLLPDAMTLEAYNQEREAGARATLLGIFAAESVLVALAIKLKQQAPSLGPRSRNNSQTQLDKKDAAPSPAVSSGGRTPLGGGTRAGPIHRGAAGFLGSSAAAARASGFLGGMPVAAGRAPEGAAQTVVDPTQYLTALGWLVAAGNLFTLACYLLAYTVAVDVVGSSDYTFLLLAPLTLLFSQEKVPHLTFGLSKALTFLQSIAVPPRRRYFAPVVSLSLGLFLSATVHMLRAAIFHDASHLAVSLGPTSAWATFVFLSRNIIAGALAAPIHYEFARFVWQPSVDASGKAPRPHASYVELLVMAPLALLAMPVATVSTLRTAGLVGIVMAAAEAIGIFRSRSRGKRIL